MAHLGEQLEEGVEIDEVLYVIRVSDLVIDSTIQFFFIGVVTSDLSHDCFNIFLVHGGVVDISDCLVERLDGGEALLTVFLEAGVTRASDEAGDRVEQEGADSLDARGLAEHDGLVYKAKLLLRFSASLKLLGLGFLELLFNVF